MELELTSAAGLAVEVMAGTEVSQPATPGRWMHRRVRGAVHRGEIRVATGRRFAGAVLRLHTPEAAVVGTGTFGGPLRRPGVARVRFPTPAGPGTPPP